MRTHENRTKRSSKEKQTLTEHEMHEFVASEYIILPIENTYLYPQKGRFMLVYCFQPIRHSIVPSFCQSVIPSTFKIFFCNMRNNCPILFKFSQHHDHQTMRVWWKNRGLKVSIARVIPLCDSTGH